MKRNEIVRTLLAALSILILVLPFASCSDASLPADSSEGTESAPVETDIGGIDFKNPEEPVVVFSGKKTYYTVVRPDSYPDELVDVFQNIMRKYRNENGINIECATDWHKPDADVSAMTEILVGNCDREETRRVMSMLGLGDYAVVKVDNKIVVAAHTPEKLSEAVACLCEKMQVVEKDGEKTVIYTENCLKKGNSSDKLLIPDADALAGYAIVYPAGDKTLSDSADKLAKSIVKAFGAELKIKDDSSERTCPEIIIGNCKRDSVNKTIGQLSLLDSVYAADPESRDLIITAGNISGTASAVKQFISEYVNRYCTNTLLITESFRKAGDAYKMDADSALAEGAEIRIMSFNLLCELWNDKPPIEGRDTRAMAIFTYYAPDVVGIQEVSDKWYSALDNCFGGLYAFTDRKTERNATNFSTLIYNTEKVKLLDHGTQVFSKGNDPRLRLVTYGVFEKLDSGKRFIVVTTHWDLGSNPQYQQIHSDEMADICLSLGKKYNLPVITTGDYNSKESSSYITNFLAKTGYIDSKYTAAEVKHDCKTYHDLGVHVSTAKAECIDHIFASPDVEFLFYNVEVSDVATDTSDHNPIYADLRLK